MKWEVDSCRTKTSRHGPSKLNWFESRSLTRSLVYVLAYEWNVCVRSKMALITIQSGAHDDMHLKYIMRIPHHFHFYDFMDGILLCFHTDTNIWTRKKKNGVCAWRWLFGSTSAAVNRLCWLNVMCVCDGGIPFCFALLLPSLALSHAHFSSFIKRYINEIRLDICHLLSQKNCCTYTSKHHIFYALLLVMFFLSSLAHWNSKWSLSVCVY